MRPAPPRYPVDRYLVESSKNLDMVKIIDDDLWKPEPSLRPEDEIMLRKLHGMLQSTADDLKLLSGELSKYHEPGVQVKTLPTPLDEDFNEKIHIEEVVNAKFHGHRIISPSQSTVMPRTDINAVQELIANKIAEHKPVSRSRIGVTQTVVQKKPLRNLGISKTRTIQIVEGTSNRENKYSEKMNVNQTPIKDKAVTYKEIIHEYEEPEQKTVFTRPLNIQEMPSINIRSELKTQNVLQLDIVPDNTNIVNNSQKNNNVAVIAVLHEVPFVSDKKIHEINVSIEQPPQRKVSKMKSYESSESSNNNKNRISPKHNISYKTLDRRKVHNDNDASKKDAKRTRTNLNEWKKKLNAVYGQPIKSKNAKAITKNKTTKVPVLQPKEKRVLNNTEYIPYTKLTLGGVNVKEIEKELSHVSSKNDVPLSPILDKILSRHNSFSNDKSQNRNEEEQKILNTSDENLMQEVLDLEEKVSSTLSKKFNKKSTDTPPHTFNKISNDNDDEDNTYADDFEVDNSEPPSDRSQSAPLRSESPEISVNLNVRNESKYTNDQPNTEHNKTYVKISNLSFKNKIDTFEFIHTVDTQDNATQSNAINKISLKETQTSPRLENDKIQTICNDLSIDPRHEVENMFKLEKDFIKKLIIDEYSDLLEKNLYKPSTSNDSKLYSDEKNVSSLPKNTQTSPARVKNVMTSPTRTKTRTTSPFTLSVTLNKQTSPMPIESHRDDSNPGINLQESKATLEEEHNITINLSSPRFSLRLPQTSRNLSNSDREIRSKRFIKPKPVRMVSSSSSVEDYSSSDISFGEINREFKRRLRRHKIPSISEPSSSSLSKYSEHSSAVVPLRSEGEISACHTKSNKHSKSEGEVSLGQLKK
ncbi:probable serine/threonine-protein kinase nek3 isoform X2 [Zerene cesonia]|nr:probable serine/threonine-protein kinase nek3 isoform X2 [Zerene cesonia]